MGFVFEEPFGDLGEYTFKVVYAPASGPKAEGSVRCQWRALGAGPGGSRDLEGV